LQIILTGPAVGFIGHMPGTDACRWWPDGLPRSRRQTAQPIPCHSLTERATLLVSFGRSGESPGSLAVVELAERLLSDCSQLIITCNEQGELFQRCRDRRGSLALLMPAETHDQSFAMTSEFHCDDAAAWLALAGCYPGNSDRGAHQRRCA